MGDNGDDDNNETKIKHKPGPLDEETIERAYALREEYEKKLLDLASECKVSIHALYRRIGESTIKHCAVLVWNTFQRYQSIHQPKPDDSEYCTIVFGALPTSPVSSKDYVKQMSRLYNERLENLTDRSDQEQLREEFACGIEWYLNDTADAVENMKDSSLQKVAKKATSEFTDRVKSFPRF